MARLRTSTATATPRPSTLTNRRLLSRLRPSSAPRAPAPRRLGDEAFTAGLAAQKHLLRGLFTADGDHRRTARIELRRDQPAGCSQDVQLILLGFGVQSTHSSTRPRRCVEPSPAEAARSTGHDDAAWPARHRARRRRIQTPRPAYRSGQPPLFGKHVGLLPGRSSSSSPTSSASRSAAASRRRQLGPRRRRSPPSASSRSSTSPSRSPTPSSPTASPCTTARSTCSSTTRRATSHR